MPARDNPFAPPEASLQQGGAAGLELAGRGTRLAAAMLDASLYGIPLLVFAMVIGSNEALVHTPWPLWSLVTVLAGVAAPQAYFVSTRGQSLGKMATHIRIVRANGAPCGFLHGVLLRSWLVTVLGLVPLAGFVLSLVNALMIFRRDRRCLHDVLADTRVVLAAGSGRGSG